MVYVSGHQKLLTKPNDVGFTMEAIKSIEVQVGNSSGGVDVLLTSQWPIGVENLAAPLVCNHSFINVTRRNLLSFVRTAGTVKSSGLL